MAKIIPFSAWRYTQKLQPKMASLTVSLPDAPSASQLDLLYSNPLNSIHVSLPASQKTTLETSTLLEEWKAKKLLEQDPSPGIYINYHYFKLPGSTELHCRKGFIALIKAYDWEDNVILRHEDTHNEAVIDQTQLLEKLQLQAHPTHGLYEDNDDHLVPMMDTAIGQPISDFVDNHGVRHVLGLITAPQEINQFINHLAGQKIILADGHHRFQASIAYKNKCIKLNPVHTGNEGYNYHMMYFSYAHSRHLKLLPTHRLIKGTSIPLPWKKIKSWFVLEKTIETNAVPHEPIQKPWTYCLVIKNKAYIISLRPEKFSNFDVDLPTNIKHLDISILHYFFVEQILDIPFDKQGFSDKLIYEKDLSTCLEMVKSGQVEMALLTKGISIDEVLKICHSGYILPQKSTYFFPKTPSGLLFGSIKKDEFPDNL
ncbi:DUF1015 domain-containing protein [Echinicola strongylocentroti]|uniref:DUF1015 domain-containing protein n=1 Tax=Echinicola strongylocentroti TaxID=1795355 RepID=A0A2Z4IER7_9BACT|nr:DUF1015 domain-containing protein [Echinicola strongylocentroti]AWW29259.1 DUF1015 domain-containing protein [Echinicola strongylocentroti]